MGADHILYSSKNASNISLASGSEVSFYSLHMVLPPVDGGFAFYEQGLGLSHSISSPTVRPCCGHPSYEPRTQTPPAMMLMGLFQAGEWAWEQGL